VFQLETFLLWVDLCTVAIGGGHVPLVEKKLSFHWEGSLSGEFLRGLILILGTSPIGKGSWSQTWPMESSEGFKPTFGTQKSKIYTR
jgi:hypothetical protein